MYVSQLLVTIPVRQISTMSRNVLILLLLTLLARGHLGVPVTPECDESIVKSVSTQCEHLESVQSLDEFQQFYANFEHLNNHCLRLKSPLKTPSESSQEAENKCKANQVTFYQTKQLARLVKRWLANERACTIEFTMQLYHVQAQLRTLDSDSHPARFLRLLANTVAWRCRYTLARRIANVERRAPDLYKFVQLIVGMINVGKGNLDKLKPLERDEQFVPILERELTSKTFGPETSNSFGQDGFELKSTNALRLSYDAVKMSCKNLKPYHVNILGPLGLLASLGFGDPATNQPKLAHLEQLKPVESRADRLMVQRWLLSALLCQTLRNVLKMQSISSEGKSVSRFKIMDTQEPDVEMDDEQDKTFATFKLPEDIPDEVIAHTKDPQVIVEFSQYKFSNVNEINTRKLHLINGPNYALANSIGTYLDVSKPTDRLRAAEQIVGLKLDMDNGQADDDEEEEEEEEE